MSLLMVRKSAPTHAADAHIDDIAYKYKVGDKIKTPDGVGIVQKKTHTNSGKPAYEVKLDKGGIVVYFEQSVTAANDSATDAADEPKSANGKVLKVGSLVVPASMKEKRRELARVVVRVEGKDPKYGFGPYVYLKGQSGAFDPAWLYAFDGNEAVDSNAEAIVNHDRIPVDQLGGEANARKHGYIIAKKGGRVYGVHIDGYSDKLAKKTIEEAGYTVVGDADEVNVGYTVLVAAGYAADSVDGTGRVARVFDSGDIEVSFGDAGTVRVPQGHFIGA